MGGIKVLSLKNDPIGKEFKAGARVVCQGVHGGMIVYDFATLIHLSILIISWDDFRNVPGRGSVPLRMIDVFQVS